MRFPRGRYEVWVKYEKETNGGLRGDERRPVVYRNKLWEKPVKRCWTKSGAKRLAEHLSNDPAIGMQMLETQIIPTFDVRQRPKPAPALGPRE